MKAEDWGANSAVPVHTLYAEGLTYGEAISASDSARFVRQTKLRASIIPSQWVMRFYETEMTHLQPHMLQTKKGGARSKLRTIALGPSVDLHPHSPPDLEECDAPCSLGYWGVRTRYKRCSGWVLPPHSHSI